ncbi:RNase J family beta-CASP ribonuclease [candidate division WWE3 bacterium]|nr:RNase J family beta-CASP ribonuclease [candidate division WWE3 bacterium]
MLKIINLGGTEDVTGNLTAFEYGDDIILVDCGIGFPDSETLGVDLVIPDFDYLRENAHKIKGLLLTHGHEDHIGAVPYFLAEFPNVPVFSDKLALGFLREKFEEKRRYPGLPNNPSLGLITPETEPLSLGVFTIEAFRVSHSVPDSLGYAIRTPEGTILHVSDFKVDLHPVLDDPIDLNRIAAYGNEGVLCLLSDCLGVTASGYSQPEVELSKTFDLLFEEAAGKQIIVTTISSNVSRIYQIISSAQRLGRKVVLLGYSISRSTEVARGLGYIPFEDDVFVNPRKASGYNQADLVYIAAGCYGQPRSALGRLSRGEHRDVKLEEGAYVIFSADPSPPGTIEPVEKVQDNLTLRGARVLFSEIQDNLHVSGHGTRGDIQLLAYLSKAKYYIPIGGSIKRMRIYSDMIGSLGRPSENVFEQREGDTVIFEKGSARKGDPVAVKDVFIDGSNIGDVGPLVLRDREKLSDDGIFVVIVPIDQKTRQLAGDVEVVTRGFVYVKESGELLNKTKQSVTGLLQKHKEGLKDWNNIREEIEKRLDKMLYKETGRDPLIFVQAIYL